MIRPSSPSAWTGLRSHLIRLADLMPPQAQPLPYQKQVALLRNRKLPRGPFSSLQKSLLHPALIDRRQEIKERRVRELSLEKECMHD